MPTKKKTTKKSKAKKPVNKKPPAKVSAEKSVKPLSESVEFKEKLRWESRALLLATILLVLTVSYAVVRLNDKAAPVDSVQSSNGSPSGLRVVPAQDAGTSSSQSSGLLQPQSTGLQQAQPTTQSGGLKLQAETTPDQNTIR